MMPFQAGKCEGCGFHDHLEYVDGKWLCRYCIRTLKDEEEEDR
jgi:hypothetical protein